jgi:hypothetical protein
VFLLKVPLQCEDFGAQVLSLGIPRTKELVLGQCNAWTQNQLLRVLPIMITAAHLARQYAPTNLFSSHNARAVNLG